MTFKASSLNHTGFEPKWTTRGDGVMNEGIESCRNETDQLRTASPSAEVTPPSLVFSECAVLS